MTGDTLSGDKAGNGPSGERRRIYINGRFLTQEVTGVQRFARELTRELLHCRSDLTVLVPRKLGAEPCAEFRAERIGCNTGHAWEQFDLPLYLKRRNAGLLLNFGNTAPLAWPMNIVTVHDLTFTRFPRSFSRSFVWWYRFLIPRLLRRSRHVVTVSEFSKLEIHSFYGLAGAKITVIANAVSAAISASAAAADPRKPYLLAVSSPVFRKNFEALLSAYAQWEFRGQIALKIVGSAATAMKQISRDDIDAVEFLGRVSDRELAALYQNALAFVFPSLYEGFGIPPLEAQSNRCPVISSNAASMPEVLGDSALYFNARDVGDIRSAMSEIARDAALRERLIERGSVNAARYSWRRSAEALSAVIDQLIGKPGDAEVAQRP